MESYMHERGLVPIIFLNLMDPLVWVGSRSMFKIAGYSGRVDIAGYSGRYSWI